jgi:hypothetical protein
MLVLTVIDFVTPGMSVATEEIFGPVISIMRTNTVDEALAIENANPMVMPPPYLLKMVAWPAISSTMPAPA